MTPTLPLGPDERRFLGGSGAPHADVFEERVLRLRREGSTWTRAEIDGRAERQLWPGEREELHASSPGASALAPFSAEDRARAEAALADAGADASFCERRWRIATRSGAWEWRDTWVDRPSALAAAHSPLEGARAETVLLEPQAAGVLLHELVGHALEAGRDGCPPELRPGTRVGPRELEIRDLPEHAVDDEGSEAAPLLLVSGGVVATGLHDLRCGASNGRARRASFRDPPLARMSHLETGPGTEPEPRLRAGATLVVARALGGALSQDGRTARLRVATATRAGELLLGPLVVVIERAALAEARIGSRVALEPRALCSREGQELGIRSSSPALLVAATVLPS